MITVPRSLAWTVFLYGFACVTILALFATMLLIVPRVEHDALAMARKLPYPTELTIALSRLVYKQFYVAMIFLITGFFSAWIISYFVRHRVESVWQSIIWFGLLIGAPLAGHAYLWLSLALV